MPKQIKLTKKEQESLPKYIQAIAKILLSKMDDGVERPELEGTMHIEEDGREVVFSIIAQKTESKEGY